MFNGLNFAPIDMKQRLATDLHEYAIATPFVSAEWVETLGGTSFTRTLQADNSGISGKNLRMSVSANVTARTLRYLPSGTPDDCEVLALQIAIGSIPVGEFWGRIFARGDPGVSAASAAFVNSASAPTIALAVIYGAAGTVQKVAYAWDAAGYHWIRMSVVGQTIKAKAWPYGTAEPAAWMITQDMSANPAPATGHVGLLSQRVSATVTHDVRFFSVSEDGLTAPFPQG